MIHDTFGSPNHVPPSLRRLIAIHFHPANFSPPLDVALMSFHIFRGLFMFSSKLSQLSHNEPQLPISTGQSPVQSPCRL